MPPPLTLNNETLNRSENIIPNPVFKSGILNKI